MSVVSWYKNNGYIKIIYDIRFNLQRMLVRELRVYKQVLLNVSTTAKPLLVPIANL